MAGAPGVRPGHSFRGFTMIELIMVLGIMAVLLGVAVPQLVGASGRVAVTDARSQVSSAVSLARAAASRYGRTSYLVLDVVSDEMEIRIDTTVAGGATPITLHTIDLSRELGVNLRASYPLMCFDPRGLSIPSGTCTGTGITVRLSRGAVADSVVVSSTGRISG